MYFPLVQVGLDPLVYSDWTIIGTWVEHPHVDYESQSIEARDDVEDAAEDIIDRGKKSENYPVS